VLALIVPSIYTYISLETKTKTMEDVMAGLAKNGKTKKQAVPTEQGNNAGPLADGVEEKGKIDIKGGSGYMDGFPQDAAEK
jgi:hypothetical protein